MRTLTLFIGFFMFQTVKAQQLSLNQLISFVNMHISDINDYLLIRNWDHNSSKLFDDEYTTIWSFDKDSDSKARGWLSIYSKEGSPNKVKFLCTNRSNYVSILNEIKKMGLKRVGSSISPQGRLSTLYNGRTYSYEISTLDRANEIIVFNRSDYLKSFSEAEMLDENIVDTSVINEESKTKPLFVTTIKSEYKNAPLKMYDDFESDTMFLITGKDDVKVYIAKGTLYFVGIGKEYGYIEPKYLNQQFP